MAYHNTPAEKQLIKFIDGLPFTPEEKQSFTEAIRSSGFNEEMAEEIHKKLAAPPEGAAAAQHGLHAVEFTRLVKQWRLTLQSKNFGRR